MLAGKARAIGRSTFLPHHLKPFLKQLGSFRREPPVQHLSTAKPLLQVTWHFTRGLGPFAQGELFQNEQVKEMATKYGKTVAQLSLAWSLQEGFTIAQIGSLRLSGLRVILNCFDFELTADDVEPLRHIFRLKQVHRSRRQRFKREYLFINETEDSEFLFLKSFPMIK